MRPAGGRVKSPGEQGPKVLPRTGAGVPITIAESFALLNQARNATLALITEAEANSSTSAEDKVKIQSAITFIDQVGQAWEAQL